MTAISDLYSGCEVMPISKKARQQWRQGRLWRVQNGIAQVIYWSRRNPKHAERAILIGVPVESIRLSQVPGELPPLPEWCYEGKDRIASNCAVLAESAEQIRRRIGE